MPATTEVTLRRQYEGETYISFVIQGKGLLDLDFISIEKRVPRKHKDKAVWSSNRHYKSNSVGDYIYWLSDYGFDTTEFERACCEMGWEKEVKAYLDEQDNLAEREAGDGEYK